MVSSANLNLMLTFKINPNHSIPIKKNQQVLRCPPMHKSLMRSGARSQLNLCFKLLERLGKGQMSMRWWVLQVQLSLNLGVFLLYFLEKQ